MYIRTVPPIVLLGLVVAGSASATTWGTPASKKEVGMIIKRVLWVRPDVIPQLRPRLRPNRKLMPKATADAIDKMESLRPGRVPTRAERPNAITGLKSITYTGATHRQMLAELFQPGSLRVDRKTGEARWLEKGGRSLRLGKFVTLRTGQAFALAPEARRSRDARVGEAMLASRAEDIRPTRYYKDRWGYSRRHRATAAVPGGGRETLPDGTRVEKSAGVWYSDSGRGPFFGDGNPASTAAVAVRVDGKLRTVISAFAQARTPSKTYHNSRATAIMEGNLYPYTLRWEKNGVAKKIHFTKDWMVVSKKDL